MSHGKIIFTLSLISSLFCAIVSKPSNNACKRFEDYSNSINNKNCYYNPDMKLETPGLIKKYIGEVKKYTLTTDDGYILTMFRIPKKNPKGVVLLQHPLITDSRVWVGQGNNSIAFRLWRKGYDVWLNNQRGTLFSQKHTSLAVTDFRYWNFSLHEIAVYDVPKQIEVMRTVTNVPKIIVIGHSLGSGILLVYGSLLSEEAQKFVKGFVALAAPGCFKYGKTIIKTVVPFKDIIEETVERLQLGNVLLFLPTARILPMLLRLYPFLLTFVNIAFSYGCGMTPDETDPEVLNFDVPINLKPFSFKIMLHFFQIMASENFQMYDYGEKKNLIYYNSTTPPLYPLQNFQVPIFFVSSTEDELTTLKDVELLLDMLPKSVQIYGHYKISGLNHVQYFLGKHREIYLDKVLNVVDEMALSPLN